MHARSRLLAALACSAFALPAAAAVPDSAAKPSAEPPASGVARPELPSPLRFDVGGFVGWSVFDANSGLGNATSPKDVPSGGFAIGAHGGVVLLDGHLGVEGQLRNAFSTLPDGHNVSVLAYRLQALWYPINEGRVLPFVTVGIGQDVLMTGKPQCPAPPVTPPPDCIYVKRVDNDDLLAVGVGARIGLSKRLGLRLQALYANGEPRPAGNGQAAGDRTNNFDVTLGVVYTLGGKPDDDDNDALANERDKCPLQAEDYDGFEDTDGCPELDNDSDGVPDVSDKCPIDDEDRDGFEDGDGCPDPDNDGDGIMDAVDKCPTQPETKNGVDDDDGCPDAADVDKDGVTGAADKCPDQAEDRDGFEDADGCPDPDNDKDGIADGRDKCPNDAEVKNGLDDGDGCPDALPDAVAAVVGKPVTVATWKGDRLLPGHEAALEPLIAFLVEQESVRLAVGVLPETATDDAKKLAESRAKALVAWMTELGIEAIRLEAEVPAEVAPAEAGKAKGTVRPKLLIQLR